MDTASTKSLFFIVKAVEFISAIAGLYVIKSGNLPVGVVIIFLTLAVATIVYYYEKKLNKPSISAEKLRVIIDIKDSSGKEARLTQISKCITNHKGITSTKFVDIGGTGGPDNFVDFTLNGCLVPEEKIEKGVNGISVREDYKEELDVNQTICSTLSYTAKNCFIDPKQGDNAAFIPRPLKSLIMEIHLPKDKPAQKAYVCEYKGSDSSDIIKKYYNVDFYNNNTLLEWEIKNPKVGRYLKLIWKW